MDKKGSEEEIVTISRRSDCKFDEVVKIIGSVGV